MDGSKPRSGQHRALGRVVACDQVADLAVWVASSGRRILVVPGRPLTSREECDLLFTSKIAAPRPTIKKSND